MSEGFNFDLGSAKEPSFDLLPEGIYTVVADEVSEETTKSGTGRYIKVKFKVWDGEHEGRAIFHNFNIQNDNPKAVEIGLGQLKQFVRVSGQDPTQVTSADQLCGMKAAASVKVKKDKSGQYSDQNAITYFKIPIEAPKAGGDVPF